MQIMVYKKRGEMRDEGQINATLCVSYIKESVDSPYRDGTDMPIKP